MTRIYSPSDYGLLGIFMSLTAIVTLFTSLQYGQAIILTQTKKEEDNLLSLAYFFLILSTLLSFIIILLVNKSIIDFFNVSGLKIWLFLIPLSSGINGLNIIQTKKLNKYRKYKKIATSQIFISISTVTVSLVLGYFFKLNAGLLLGLISGQFLGLLVLYLGNSSLKYNSKHVSIKRMRFLLLKYKKFPIYSLPSEFLFTWTSQLPIYIFSKFFTSKVVGLFNYGSRMTALPVSFLTKAIGQVFAQKAAENFQKNGNCKDIYISTLKLLISVLFFPFLILTIWGPTIFEFVFGAEWREAGVYVQILSFMYFLRSITSPLSYMFIIRNKQNEDFILHIITFIFVGSSLLMGYFMFNDIKIMLSLFAISYSIIYIYYLFRSYKFSY